MPRRDDRSWGLRQRVEHWAERLHVPAPRVRVRDMTRKWGSCSTAGTITLATDLGNQDVGFQDFVIAHELLHLRVPNHGEALQGAHDSARARLENLRCGQKRSPRGVSVRTNKGSVMMNDPNAWGE